ncbi:MAG TPA: hypothetical protein VD993_20650 [Chitinophagaceae bacterium]|nr:hypothetical protein [Chitinophagaceae bacterium]
MKSIARKIQCALLILVATNVWGQTEKQAVFIHNDPDWQIILRNNSDFLNRLARQPYSLSDIWSLGQENFLRQLNYSRSEYYQKQVETRQAAARLLSKYPDVNTMGSCNGCGLSEAQLTGKVDAFVRQLRQSRLPDAETYLREMVSGTGGFRESAAREIDADESSGPQCGWKFYACAIVCAGTIEAFPVYLACCAICLCEYCKNPPSWCD